MAIANMTTQDSLLKDFYDDQMVQSLTYKNRPLLAMLPKNENFGGRRKPFPVIYGNPQNRAATFSNAVALTTSSLAESFDVTRVKNYSLAFIDNETWMAAESDKGAFMSVATGEIDRALAALSDDLAFSLCRSSSGARGQVLAEPSEAATTVITLKIGRDVTGFDVGQVINIYSAESGGSLRVYDTGVSDGTVSAVDRSAGTVTITSTGGYTSSGTIAANDYIFVKGDRGLKTSGLADWIPDSAPSSAAFFGVDRSVDAVRLGGVRTTGTGMDIKEALIQGVQDVADLGGGDPDHIFVNPKQMAKLQKSMQGQVQYVNLDVNGIVAFQGIQIMGPTGKPVVVMADRNIRDQRAYIMQMDTWQLASLGSAVQILNRDVQALRQATADAYEVRCGFYGNLVCMAPGFNGVVSLDA